MKAAELLRNLASDVPELDVTGLTSDSRTARPGWLFICHTGLRRDGCAYAAEALGLGAAAVIAPHPIDGIPPEKTILTPDTRLAESVLWNRFCGEPADGMTKIAVTGTAGKTSVTFILREILMTAGRKVGVISTLGAFSGHEPVPLGENGGAAVSDIPGAMTTPDPEYFFRAVERMKRGECDTLIWEASSQSQLMKRTAAICPDAAVFTNLSPEHMDCHGSMENYFAAKATLMKGAGIAVINTDDEWMRRLPELYPQVPVVRCSAESGKVAVSDACAIKTVLRGADGIEYVYFSENAVFRVRSPLIGRMSVQNTLLAAAAALAVGTDAMITKEALDGFSGVPGRMNRVKLPGVIGFSVFIDYAHTPSSLASVLDAMREITKGRLIVLFGCGGDRDRQKRPLMAEAAGRGADYVILTSDNARTEDPDAIITEAAAGLDPAVPHAVIRDRAEAIRFAVRMAETGDTVLLAGKGHEKYEIRADGMVPFDEEAIVRAAVRDRFGSRDGGGADNER